MNRNETNYSQSEGERMREVTEPKFKVHDHAMGGSEGEGRERARSHKWKSCIPMPRVRKIRENKGKNLVPLDCAREMRWKGR